MSKPEIEQLDIESAPTPSVGEAAEGRMTPDQCRVARKLLGWKQIDLMKATGVNTQSIGSFERIGRLPRSKSGLDYREAIRSALEAAGIEFTEEDAPGVRLRKSGP